MITCLHNIYTYHGDTLQNYALTYAANIQNKLLIHHARLVVKIKLFFEQYQLVSNRLNS